MNIAVIAAHPDDAELGLGATMALLVSQGHRVLIIDATNGEPTPFGDVATRAQEAAEAATILGVERMNLGWTNRAITHDLASRHALAAQLRLNTIDIMFVPHPLDTHPDHLALTKICVDARFDAKLTKCAIAGEPHHPRRLFHYFCTHLKHVPQPDFIVNCAGFEQKKDAGHSRIQEPIPSQPKESFNSKLGGIHGPLLWQPNQLGFWGANHIA